MIPAFNGDGNLPSGIVEVSITEFELKFVTNIKRRLLYNSLRLLITNLTEIGCKTIYIDGSFTTVKELPNDIDVCWDHAGVDLSLAQKLIPELWDKKAGKAKYNCDIFPAFVLEGGSGKLFLDFFQTDRDGNKKGIIKLSIEKL